MACAGPETAIPSNSGYVNQAIIRAFEEMSLDD